MRIELSRLAQFDLIEVVATIAADRPSDARRWKARLDEAIGQIADFPGIGTRREELAPGMRSFPVPPFLILYRIPGDDSIEVLRVVHGARDLPHLMSPQDQPPETGSF